MKGTKQKKVKIRGSSFLIKTSLFACFIVIAFQITICAQAQTTSNDKLLLPPAEEEFKKNSDLLAPWRETGCYRGNILHKEPNCPVIKNDEYLKADTLSLYDKDATLWYTFSLTPSKNDYFLKNKKNEFSPLALPGLTVNPYLPRNIILRITGESAHWYEVEINEKTKETKFVLKNDPMWAKTNWSYWLYYWTNLKIDGNKTKLLDSPNGKVIESSSAIVFDTLKFLKAEGEWALVMGFHNNAEFVGWIRWRDDRRILVGCIFNDLKVPEPQLDESTAEY